MSIQISNLTKLYGAQKALNAVSFSVDKGEIVGFLGPNGAGKSTLMKILTGYLPASEGSAKVCDFEVSNHKLEVQKRIGYLPEHNPLYLDMYVREYLRFCAKVNAIDTQTIETVISETGLLPEANKKISSLSKGYRQRVGLASALLHNPDVLILDEPTTGLDPNQLVDIRQLIKTSGINKTVFLSTHIMQEVEAICDRVIIINNGEIVADESLSDLRKNQKQIIEVEFDYRVETVAIERMPNLTSAKNTIGFVYELEFDTAKDMRPAVFDFAYDNGLKTLQLNQKNTNLEDLFRELTAKQPA
jgi:ABC-2 type transport system ATP-binding protein